jgi:CelD/BcsL family acetyltransferase involved in cellulose biosynthesis
MNEMLENHSAELDLGTERIQRSHGISSLKIQEVRDYRQLKALEPYWNQTLVRSGSPLVYLTYEWLTTWWRCLGGDGKELLVLVVTDGSEILGIAPFMKVHESFVGLPVSKIGFVSMVKYADSPVNFSGSLDIIVARRHKAVIEALVSYLKLQEQNSWHVLHLNPLPETSPSLGIIEQEARKRRLRFEKRVVFSHAYSKVESDWANFFNKRGSSFRKKLRLLERRLQRKGAIAYNEYRSLGEIPKGYDEILDIERRSWKWERGVSINSVGYRDFYREFAEEAGKKGWFRLWVLKVDGKSVAYDYHVEFEGYVETLKGSYDEDYSDCSPGNLLTWRECEHFFQNGAKRINLLWGNEDYKRHWSTHQEAQYEVFLFNSDLYSRFLHFLYFRLALYGKFRLVSDLKRRLLRRLGYRSKRSELTRLDQLENR